MITYERFQIAAFELLLEQRKVTQANIRAKLGSGSESTINKFIKRFKEEGGADEYKDYLPHHKALREAANGLILSAISTLGLLDQKEEGNKTGPNNEAALVQLNSELQKRVVSLEAQLEVLTSVAKEAKAAAVEERAYAESTSDRWVAQLSEERLRGDKLRDELANLKATHKAEMNLIQKQHEAELKRVRDML